MLLAVDSSTQHMGLALYDGVQTVADIIWESQNHHTVELAPAVQDLLKRSGVEASQLRALSIALGPGTFTGLRIGLALIKGLALALHLPVIGVPTLDFLAASQPTLELPLAAILRAGRGRIAIGWYLNQDGHWKAEGPAKVSTVAELAHQIRKPTYICGELNAEERQMLARKHKNVILASPAQSMRRPSFLAELAWQRWQAGDTDEVISLSPIYLHISGEIQG